MKTHTHTHFLGDFDFLYISCEEMVPMWSKITPYLSCTSAQVRADYSKHASGSNTASHAALSSSATFKLRWTSLSAFVVSHAVLTCVLRIDVLHEEERNPVISSTVVCFSELCKLFLSCVAVLYLDCTGSTLSERMKCFFVQIKHAFLDEAADLLKLCVPSLLYTFQNNFQYVIETSPLFVILYQGKNITTGA